MKHRFHQLREERLITKSRFRLARPAALTAAALLAFAVSVIGTASPASAATTLCVYEDNDRACATNNWPAERSTSNFEVCDNERDGHGVYGILDKRLSGNITLRDGNGSDPGCGRIAKINDGPLSLTICEEEAGADDCVTWLF